MKLSLVAVVLVAACTPPIPPEPPPPSVVGDGLGTPIGEACVQLRKIGCPEGAPSVKTGRTCFQTYANAAEVLGAIAPTECLRASTTPDEIRACGDANTIRVKCQKAAP